MQTFNSVRYLFSRSKGQLLYKLTRGAHSGDIFRIRNTLSSATASQTTMAGNNRPRVFVSRNIPDGALGLLKAECEVTQWMSDEPIPRSEMLQSVPGIDALYCLLTDKVDVDVINSAGSNLKVISTMSVGHDHIDLKECKSRSIVVGYTPDVLTDATAELTVALLLSVSRRILEGVSAVRGGEWSSWKPLWMCGQGLTNSTVGVVGLGRIGYGVAKRIQPFGPKTILYSGNKPTASARDIGAEFVSFNELLQRSDFVIVTCPLNDQTKGLFDKNAFSKMKSTAILINTSRGPVVDQEDLYTALTTGAIRAAGLDVTVPEPLPTDHPLLSLKNCVVLPHIGSATEDARNMMAEIAARNVLEALAGREMPAQLQL